MFVFRFSFVIRRGNIWGVFIAGYVGGPTCYNLGRITDWIRLPKVQIALNFILSSFYSILFDYLLVLILSLNKDTKNLVTSINYFV